VATAVAAFMRDRVTWTGTVTELLRDRRAQGRPEAIISVFPQTTGQTCIDIQSTRIK
jgi:hypothetical protein